MARVVLRRIQQLLRLQAQLAFNLKFEKEGRHAGEGHGQDGQQAPVKGGKDMTLHLVGGGGGGERPPKGKDNKGHGKKGKDDFNTEHFSTGGLHHARGSVATTTSVVFAPSRGDVVVQPSRPTTLVWLGKTSAWR